MPIAPPLIRAGRAPANPEPANRIVAFFYNTAQGNVAIQQLVMLGVPADRLGVTTPDRIDTGQGMLLSIACPDPALVPKVEALLRSHGAELHRQPAR